MTSADPSSNNKNLKEKIPGIKRPEFGSNIIHPTIIYNQPSTNPRPFESNFSEKNNNYLGERFNSFNSEKGFPNFDLYNQIPFPPFKNMGIPPMISFPFSRIFYSNKEKEEQKLPINIPNQFMLNSLIKENDEFYKDKKDENKNKAFINIKTEEKNNSNNSNSSSNSNSSEKSNSPEKNININNNANSNNNMNSVTKFFTNHNYGYKCSCSKTQCNRKYCECYNSGNYCVDCNCKNCNNKPPVNSYTNKRPSSDDTNKLKKEKIICTCTKSGCNKNYCECFKIGQKCSVLCRCIGCENNDQIQRKKYNYNYQCNLANSIYIIKNKICVENLKDKKREELIYEEEAAPIRKYDFVGICKKRKREENKNEEEEKNFRNNNKKMENTDEVNLFNDSLFDQNGKVILRHINLFHL